MEKIGRKAKWRRENPKKSIIWCKTHSQNCIPHSEHKYEKYGFKEIASNLLDFTIFSKLLCEVTYLYKFLRFVWESTT